MNIRQAMEIKTINSRIKAITINLNGLFICNSENDCVMPAFNVVAVLLGVIFSCRLLRKMPADSHLSSSSIVA